MRDDPSTWTVTDDWPEEVPVTEAEIEVFEVWFGYLFFDQMGPVQFLAGQGMDVRLCPSHRLLRHVGHAGDGPHGAALTQHRKDWNALFLRGKPN
jgi:hypothetical protein